MSTDNIASLEAARTKKERGAGGGGAGPAAPARDARPTVRVEAGSEVEAMREAERHLIASGSGVYQTGEALVKVARSEVWAARKEKTWSLRFHALEVPAILREFSEAARFERYDARAEDYVTKPCPELLAKMYAKSADQWRVPTISAIVTAPTLRPDGSLLDEPGLDPSTGLYYWPTGETFPRIPDRPTRVDALRAMAMLKALLRTMAFEGGGTPASWNDPRGEPLASAHRSVALSAILTAVSRLAYPTAPVHGFSSHEAGSGKSKIVDVVSMIAVGHRAAVTAAGSDDVELEKRLAGDLLAGERIISIDNAERPIGGELLCQIASAEMLKIRPLGGHKKVSVPNAAMVMFTGVNASVLGDMTRRTLMATVDPGHERPERDRFRFDPVSLAERGRGRLVAAVLTLLRAWLTSGERGNTSLGSFEGWNRVVREALLWLDEPDPMEVVEGVRDSDPRLAKLRQVMAEWSTTFGPSPKSMKEVREAASLMREGSWANGELRAALLGAINDGSAREVNSNKLDWWLRRNAGRRVDGMRFVRTDEDRKVPRWGLEGAGSIPEATVDDEIPF